MATVAARQATAPARGVGRAGVLVALGGQVERAVGIATALLLRRGLDPARLGVYTGLRLLLDHTNRTSLGIGLGAVQEIPRLRGAGRPDEADRVADVAYTTNTITCLLYAAGLLLWAGWRSASPAAGPLAFEWTFGLAAVAGLVLLKRYESFLIAVLRARGEFGLTTRLDVFEALVSLVAIAGGVALAGFVGLLAAVGVILAAKVAYLHAAHPLRFRWAWEPRAAWQLMRMGLPILLNTVAFGAVMGLDRVLILTLVPDGERAAGLYSVALLGAGWGLDLAGRVATVLATEFPEALGRSGDPSEVARRAARATEALALPLAAAAVVADNLGPTVLGTLLPRYADGLPALRPLLPGAVLLGLAWPARQALIAVGRPYRLLIATTAGAIVSAEAGTIGAVRGGIVGVAGAMSIGFAAVWLATSVAALSPSLGGRGWAAHLVRLAVVLGGVGLVGAVAARAPGPCGAAIVALGLAPMGWAWRRRFESELRS